MTNSVLHLFVRRTFSHACLLCAVCSTLPPVSFSLSTPLLLLFLLLLVNFPFSRARSREVPPDHGPPAAIPLCPAASPTCSQSCSCFCPRCRPCVRQQWRRRSCPSPLAAAPEIAPATAVRPEELAQNEPDPETPWTLCRALRRPLEGRGASRCPRTYRMRTR